MKKSPISYGIPLFFLLMLAACTQNDMKVDTAQNETVTARSTQAECDSIQSNLPQVTDEDFCFEIAALTECRLNQGINEDSIVSNCDQIDSYNFLDCINTSQLLINYSQTVEDIKKKVYDNTDGCPPFYCPPPTNQVACRIIIFSVSYNSSFCGPNDCEMVIEADVYCCN